MIIAYLIIATFAAAFAVEEFNDNRLIAGIWGLFWPFMLLMVLFYWWVSRR